MLHSKLRELEEVLEAADTHEDRLTKWEIRFCEDMRLSVLEFGVTTSVSEKQWDVIAQISEKVFGA